MHQLKSKNQSGLPRAQLPCTTVADTLRIQTITLLHHRGFFLEHLRRGEETTKKRQVSNQKRLRRLLVEYILLLIAGRMLSLKTPRGSEMKKKSFHPME